MYVNLFNVSYPTHCSGIVLHIHSIYCSDVSGIAAAMLISSQISYEFIELPENGLVKLKFDNVRI